MLISLLGFTCLWLKAKLDQEFERTADLEVNKKWLNDMQMFLTNNPFYELIEEFGFNGSKGVFSSFNLAWMSGETGHYERIQD